MTDNSPLGLYLHIPFCVKRCAYCDFFSGFSSREMLESYTKGLIYEIKNWGGLLNRPNVNTVYFGGGTPSLLGERIIPVVVSVREAFNISEECEITYELNPDGDISKVLAAAEKAGVNRLSIGVQSGDDKMLSLLGRTHTAAQSENAVKTARRLGFKNISLDLMIGLPGSGIQTLKDELDFVLGLEPEHISAYILKVEQNTLFGKKADKLNLPNDDEVGEQYAFMCEYLRVNGFRHYEISNFCRGDNLGAHNLKYWRCEEYLGIGPSAHSYLSGKRFYYPRDMKSFLSGEKPLYDGIGGEEEEYIMLSLRLDTGLNFESYRKKYGRQVNDKIKKAALTLSKEGLCLTDNEKIALTDKGMAVSNSVITYLLECL